MTLRTRTNRVVPSSIHRWIQSGLLLAVLIGGAALHASAADVRIAVSSKETYVGMPVVLQIQISNASKVEPPVVPEVEGLEVHSRGTPSRSTHVVTINGSTRTTTSQTYLYEIVPLHAGTFRIPPVTVEVDGTRQRAGAIEFVATKSETGDLLFVEVTGAEKQIHVGQALDLTLKIWLRPFRDKARDITLSPSTMWQMISRRTSWGAFSDQVNQLAAIGQRPASREVLRKDRSGVERSYNLYELDATIYPKRPGKIDANDIRVVVEYPVSLGQTRDPFASMLDDMQLPGGFGSFFRDDDFPSPFRPRLVVESVRPIVADATVEPIEVLAIPTAGRPSDYRGAVGQYQIVTEAKPLTVKAGDPINLFVGIAGTGPMELVQAPPLAELSELTADFKVPDEPLAGFVQDQRKVFSTTIRPRSEGVQQIPSIPFSYFDPDRDQFVTVHSKPIPIRVDPADHLALDSIVGRETKVQSDSNRRNEVASSAVGVSLENFTGEDVLRNETTSDRSRSWLVLLLVMPPLVVLAMGAVRSQRRMVQLLGRFGYGLGRTRARIVNAEKGADVGLAFQRYFARSLKLNPESPVPAEVTGALRIAGFHKLAIRYERIFNELQDIDSAGGIGQRSTLEELKRQALDVVTDLQRQSQKKHGTPSRSTYRAAGTSARLTCLALLAGSLLWTNDVARADEFAPSAWNRGTQAADDPLAMQHEDQPMLTPKQKTAVLAEATELYGRAMQSSSADSAHAKQAFADAAEKYQLLVDTGIANSRLYVNLANAYLQSGQRGRAIAHYRKALRLDPTNRTASMNLQYAQQSGNVLSDSLSSDGAGANFRAVASAVNQRLTSYIHPQAVGAIGIASWFAAWIAVGLRTWNIRFPWKSVVAMSLLICMISATSFAIHGVDEGRAIAIVTEPTVMLRGGDGASFSNVNGGELREGQEVTVIKRRGNWIKVRSGTGQVGWLAPEQVTLI